MRLHDKHWKSVNDKDIFGVNLHQFMEQSDQANRLEIAEELGITASEVKSLKKKINRT
ncbi:hypothetical protein [Oceanobacillus chungangensis]|uniref:hypothetical protein n=1 Tax=Oceanobacillus chungangensis TaxID=1229152 RepID=UPI0014735680|nr:hypothetical protein [Oceanobacillus chungangensis]